MPLKFMMSRPKPSQGLKTNRGVTALCRVKSDYQQGQQAQASQQASRIKQLSTEQTRLNRAVPVSQDPVQTALKRRSDLVGRRIGWLQQHPK